MKTSAEKHYWVYMLYCDNDSYYTGYSTDMRARYRDHVNGTGGCKYTRSFKPVKLAQCWLIKDSKSLAMQLEHAIKRYTRARKEMLIMQPEQLSADERVHTLSAKQIRALISINDLDIDS